MSEELVDALVEIHAVDWEACGLGGYGKPTGYLERQLRRFGGLWEHNKTRELPRSTRSPRGWASTSPSPAPATIVHGDYRLGNVMFAPETPARLIASSTGRWRRSATRSPTSATSSPRGRARRPRPGDVRARRA